MKPCLRFCFFILYVCAATFTYAQTSHIGGIINSYGSVSNINFCTNVVTVDNVSGFAVGEQVLMIQMRGAEISTANDPSYGDITNYRGCGNYEFNTIASINGNDIEFTYAIKRSYEVTGQVQIVSLPRYQTAYVDSALKPKVWDGYSGGIVLLQADSLILNDSISVKGKGFRGAPLTNDAVCFNNGIGGATAFSCPTSDCGALKGEGVANSAQAFGRGKNGSGGGGGNDHNTGGGGGSNYGAGGKGGTRTGVSNFSCPGPGAGEGGTALLYNNTENRIFMGGGGGSGDENNTQGSPGANGGGLVIILAGTLVGNGKQIKAGGDSVFVKAKSDAAGGGGAAGTILLSVDNFVGSLIIDLVGGKGGNLNNGNDPDFCFGPGGGGAGGVLWLKSTSLPGSINLVDTGGLPGHQTYALAPGFCPFGATNGALRGNNGATLFNLEIPFADTPFIQLTADACCDTTVCPNVPVTLTASGTATFPPTFLWSNGSTNSSITETTSTSTDFLIVVSDQRGCTYSETLHVTVLNGIDSVSVCCDTTLCAGGIVNFSTAVPIGNFTYSWSSGQTTSSISQSVSSSQTFTVTITNENNCSTSESVSATISNNNIPFTVCCDTTVCAGATVSLSAISNQSLSYQWSSGETNAVVSQHILFPQLFSVTATDINGCSGSSTVSVSTNNINPTLMVCCDTLVCSGSIVVLSINSTNGAKFNWSTGETVNSITPSVSSAQTFTVTVTDVNFCTATASVQVDVPWVQTQITAVPDTSILLGQSVQLSASGSSYFYSWSPGDGLTATNIKNPIATPQVTTTYCVTATDQNSCTASACFEIELLLPDVKIPDGFTPNNDGNNDLFQIFPLKFAEVIEMRIYNRWGEVVYYAKGNSTWDGNYKGNIQPSGSYVCTVTFSSSLTPGKINTVSKDIVLIR